MKKTYGQLAYQEGAWYMTKVHPHVCIKVKALFPHISLTARPPFKFPNNPDVCNDILWFTQRYPMDISEKDLEKLTFRKVMYDLKGEDLEKILSEDYVPQSIVLKNNHSLRDYQGKAVELFLKNKALFLADDLGLGKTVTGIGVLAKQESLPAVIVVPTHLASHWSEKIREFTNLRIHNIKGTKPYALPPVDVYIFKYSVLAGWIDFFEKMKYKTVIFDEVHALRRAESNRYEAAKELVKYAEQKLGLSATPIFNYGDEIFNILDVLNEGCLGKRDDFIREWTNQNKIIKDPKALGSYLRDNYYFLRRTTKDVGRELPPINKIVQNVDFDHKMVNNSEQLMRDLAQKVVSGTFTERGQAARELDIFVRKITGISKARAVAEYVKILLANDRPVLLAGWHRACYDIWMKELAEFNPVFYTGHETGTQKDASATAFKTNKSNLMIMSLRSGEGLDGLQFKCSDVVFGELDWSPAVHEQFTGRIYRQGQEDQVTVHYMVSSTGSDPLMIELLGLKSSQARNIVDPFKPVENVISDDSRMKMLAEKILKTAEPEDDK